MFHQKYNELSSHRFFLLDNRHYTDKKALFLEENYIIWIVSEKKNEWLNVLKRSPPPA